ncbi:MAG: UTP--glucose-1-phosphate uridylyltransferase, partial [Limisphaerales bacterium]
MAQTSHFAEFAEKMRNNKVSDAAIRAFENNYSNLVAGQTGLIPESQIEPVTSLLRYEDLSKAEPDAKSLLARTVVLKLNGGLGTSMGLEKAKSLLPIKNGLTFLDFIAKQILFLRQRYDSPLRFLLMNSFSTSE